jgi:hypothetical protein
MTMLLIYSDFTLKAVPFVTEGLTFNPSVTLSPYLSLFQDNRDALPHAYTHGTECALSTRML